VILDGIAHRAVGIFKTEEKSSFIETGRVGTEIHLRIAKGADLGRFDKGCLVLLSDDQTDPVVLITDRRSRGEEAVYWRENFLGCEPRNTGYRLTAGVMQATHEFVAGYESEETAMSRTDKIDLLNRSVSWFKSRDNFEQRDFEQEVLGDPALIRDYRRFRSDQGFDVEGTQEGFQISAAAVRHQARVFRSVLKLDRNFHIYIHGDRHLIQQGREPDGRKFYKIYFENES
jgi:hypothetical protein